MTQADTEAQEVIYNLLIEVGMSLGVKAEEDIGFIGEEKLSTGMKKHMFIIDPLDGTANFATGLDLFCVLIGYLKDGKKELGYSHLYASSWR